MRHTRLNKDLEVARIFSGLVAQVRVFLLGRYTSLDDSVHLRMLNALLNGMMTRTGNAQDEVGWSPVASFASVDAILGRFFPRYAAADLDRSLD